MQCTRSIRSTVYMCATAAIASAGARCLSGPRMPPRTRRRAQRAPPTAEQRWLLVVSRINILRRMRQEWSSVGMFLNWWRNEHLRGRRRALPNHIVQPLGWEVGDLAQRPEMRLIILVHELAYIGFLAVQLHEIDRCRTAFFGYRLQ